MHLLAVTSRPLDMMIGPVRVTIVSFNSSSGSLKKHLFRHRRGVEDLHATVVLPQHDALDALVHSPHPMLRGILMYKVDSFPIVDKQPIIPPASVWLPCRPSPQDRPDTAS
jgi:hypothetical protein